MHYSCRVVCAAEACSCRPAATVDRVSGYDETRAARNKSIPFTRLIESGFPLCRSASAANGTITQQYYNILILALAEKKKKVIIKK